MDISKFHFAGSVGEGSRLGEWLVIEESRTARDSEGCMVNVCSLADSIRQELAVIDQNFC